MYRTAEGSVVPEPLRVSPLIRVGRWTLLFAGIAWGIHRHNVLSVRETKYREVKERERPAKEAARALERARLFAEQEKELLAAEKGGAASS